MENWFLIRFRTLRVFWKKKWKRLFLKGGEGVCIYRLRMCSPQCWNDWKIKFPIFTIFIFLVLVDFVHNSQVNNRPKMPKKFVFLQKWPNLYERCAMYWNKWKLNFLIFNFLYGRFCTAIQKFFHIRGARAPNLPASVGGFAEKKLFFRQMVKKIRQKQFCYQIFELKKSSERMQFDLATSEEGGGGMHDLSWDRTYERCAVCRNEW